jgi:pseudouridylate synthase
MREPFIISPEIKHALNYNKPVVALESSYFANGLPKEVNIEAVNKVEQSVKDMGAFPASIAIIEGEVKIGLSENEIKLLAQGDSKKAGVRDIPLAVLEKWNAGTTVSAAARIASAAGIGILATGGIGGVHIGFDKTLDISSDLWELARNSIVVICSGAKSILDISATCEWLETYSIPIYGLNTSEMPAFYSRKSGINIPEIKDIDRFVQMLNNCPQLGMKTSTILAVPVPEEYELDINDVISDALESAKMQNISGKQLTPFLLAFIADNTNGKATSTNIALLVNNAKTASQIASKLANECERRMGFIV